jgi:DNA-binding transcriptional LysR family regulator
MEQEMKYIYTIYKEKNFSKAADKLFMTQSALSMAVQRVEARLGETVFDRSKRPLQLTPAGKIYIQKYFEIMQLENELQEQINDLSDLKRGTLVIGATQYLSSYILAPIILEFIKCFPSINLKLVECGSNKLSKKLLNGSIDLTLKCDEYGDPLTSEGIAFRDNLLLSIPKAMIEEYGIPQIGLNKDQVITGAFFDNDFPYLDFSYLNQIPIISLTPGNNLHTRLMALFQQNNISPNVTLEVQQMVTAYHLSTNGLGATLVSEHIISQNLDKDALYFKIDSPLMVRNFEFIVNKKSYLSKTAKKFMEMTTTYYQD